MAPYYGAERDYPPPASRQTHKIREDDAHYHSTCDWGYCDGIATWWRYDRETGHFLPVCGACAHKQYRRSRG